MKLLMAMALLLIGNVWFIAYLLVRVRRLQKPLTSADSLRAAPHFSSPVIRRLRLTSRGKWIIVMAVPFGALLTVASLGLAVQIATTGLTKAVIPATVAVLIFDLVPVAFVVLLYRTYRFLLTGRLTTGIVVSWPWTL
ncbi:MAG TPA: hypothetical protein VEH00_05425 [Steroidobacteraceae bacterium]|nr:hypothetical protein [Steroidobacteraceae bacterium]